MILGDVFINGERVTGLAGVPEVRLGDLQEPRLSTPAVTASFAVPDDIVEQVFTDLEKGEVDR
jgi:hypothetical protein